MAKRRRIRRRVLYPIIGLLLSFSAPLGWLAIRISIVGWPSIPISEAWNWIENEFVTHILEYEYMHVGAILTLGVAGFALGWRDDKIRQHYNKVVSQRRLLSIKNRQLARLSITDHLTGLANRLRLMDVLSLEFKRAKRYSSDLCVMVVDVDYFKRINDTYGHMMGDFVLHELGQIFAGNLRETDSVARTGGEEFCFVLTQTNVPDALKFADRIRENVAAHVFDYKGTKVDVRLSIGVASIKDLSPEEMDEKGQHLYRAADEALYLAKRLGRNRVNRYKPSKEDSLTA